MKNIHQKKIFNRETMQLVGIYIRNYKVFHNQCFSLNSNYTLEMNEIQDESQPQFIINKRPDVDLFKEYGLNIKVICGMNGAGKSSLIELMRNANYSRERNIYFFIDEKNNLISATEKTAVLLNGEKRICDPNDLTGFSVAIQGNAGFDYENKEDGLLFRENFFDYYYDDLKLNGYKKSIYDFDKDGRLLTHFSIQYKNSYNSIFRGKFQVAYDIEAEELERENPLYGILLHSLSNYEEFIENIGKIESQNKLVNGIKNILVLYLNQKKIKSKFDSLDKELQQIVSVREPSKIQLPLKFKTKKSYSYPEKIYQVKQYELIRKKLNDIYKRIDVFWNKNKIGYLAWPFFISPFKLFKNSAPRHLYDLSDGEYKMLEIRWKAYVSLYQVHDVRGYWICFDEPEKHLHPEWARNLISMLIAEINHIRNYISDKEKKSILKKRTISLILATHSPFLLSDLNVNNILMLKKEAEGFVKEITPPKSFGGNIGSMFYDSFFLKSTIGSFAEKTIKTAMSQFKRTSDKSKKQTYMKIIDMISDPIVKSLAKETMED